MDLEDMYIVSKQLQTNYEKQSFIEKLMLVLNLMALYSEYRNKSFSLELKITSRDWWESKNETSYPAGALTSVPRPIELDTVHNQYSNPRSQRNSKKHESRCKVHKCLVPSLDMPVLCACTGGILLHSKAKEFRAEHRGGEKKNSRSWYVLRLRERALVFSFATLSLVFPRRDILLCSRFVVLLNEMRLQLIPCLRHGWGSLLLNLGISLFSAAQFLELCSAFTLLNRWCIPIQYSLIESSTFVRRIWYSNLLV